MRVIDVYADNSLRNFSYILIKDQHVVCIDPFDGQQIEKVLKQNELVLTAIINTHQHHDHIKGNNYLINNYACPILNEDLIFNDGSELVQIKTPGHTNEHVTYAYKEKGKEKLIFCGDTLFNAGVGNCKNGGNDKVLYESITKIYYKFPKTAIIYTGHDYRLNNLKFSESIWSENKCLKEEIDVEEELRKDNKFRFTFLAEEFDINPFFNLKFFREKFKLDSEEEAFIYLRKLRDNW